jgi:superfamily I DNA/RNA helicase
MLAALDITASINDKDIETLKDQFVKRGDSPVYFKASNELAEIEKIKKYIHDSAMELRVTYGNVAVLCSTKNIGLEFEAKLKDFNAKFFDGRHLDLSHKGIKILTMHSAKGLQFPIVVIPRLTSQFLNYSDREIDFIDRKRKLLFVAFSRAMNKLLVTSLASSECGLMSMVSDDHWDIE